jgi:hypothetical protein
MNESSDVWYVRLPDGRVMRAKSAAAVRLHLEGGRIPLESRARRSAAEDWQRLDHFKEFADLIHPSGRGGEAPVTSGPKEGPSALPFAQESDVARSESMHLETVGVRGMIEQLLAGLDHTFVRTKLWLSAVSGAGIGLAVVLAFRFVGMLDWWADVLVWSVLGLLLLWVVSACFAIITQMTVLELSRFRSAPWAEAVVGVGRHSRRLMFVYLVVGGSVAVLLVLFRWLPEWLLRQPDLDIIGEVLAAVLLVVGLLVEVILWPILGLMLLLAPVVVVEECSAVQALEQWWRLLREHLGRILLYEALAAALAAVAALPFVFPVFLTTLGLPPLTELLGIVASVTLGLLGGLALTPLIAYLVVANVGIYLNLRYEHTMPR